MWERRVRTGRIVVGLVGGLMVVAGGGCGGSSSGPSDASPSGASTSTTRSKGAGASVDVCAIVTADDAATVFGAPAQTTDPDGTQGGAVGVCIYEGVNESFTVRNLLQVRVYPSEVYYGQKIFPKSESLPGIGEKAFINVNESGHVVDLQLVVDGRTGAVNYSGGSAVDVNAKVGPLEAVAKQLAQAL